MKLTLDIENEQDLFLILSFAKRVGIKILDKDNSVQDNLEYHRKIISQGVKKSSFGDPMLWQRETRKDRNLPLRTE
ncbi:MAG TPA: hypothetical protein PK079_15710 [Leptospiraceae bacterium]|nr:hypothetical protein [Leptospiraceae bacterium]HMX33383.1 hypothetical protein [Leptospiraceae bacterium]HMY32949.1 hypothetical protein [Leptospiraceae bacterium]HMZ64563.1 hypothetical protein [Leptospiraceae bacterium]HNA08200.1 hypothetical protein [Leptospiraceae bacterium]